MPRQRGPTDVVPYEVLRDYAETDQGAVFSRDYDATVNATTTQPIRIFTAPWPCRLLVAWLTIPNSAGTVPSDPTNTDYWTFHVRRYRGTQVLPLPASGANGLVAGNITVKTTTGNGISPRFGFRLTQSTLDPVNAVFRTGEMLGLIMIKTGTPADLLGLGLTARVERI